MLTYIVQVTVNTADTTKELTVIATDLNSALTDIRELWPNATSVMLTIAFDREEEDTK